MNDIVERLADIRRQLDGSKSFYAAGTVQAAISEIDRLRRIINDVHPQMQARIDALTAERDAMLAALKVAFDMRLTNHPEWEAIARAAIAKAEGRAP